MQIHIATTADIDELTKVEIESKLKSFYDNDEVGISHAIQGYRWQTYFDAQTPASAKPERVVYKAVLNGHIIGYVAGHLTTRYEKDAEIQAFYLLKEQQRKGYGTKMLAHLLDWFKQFNVKSVCVGIDKDNPYQQFYLKHGGEHINEHWIGWDDVVALEAAVGL
ncbi:GNAT family N-acetyltransferase [Mucilaginibacter sp. HMF5004]|uniref:GNAT family N-acetyltransferase n=1 Tax=Mucilaginibacter rivuli TaxID=2857527 RepID=UPI001C5DA0D6|nr:GNAT family N-acetyltransferase [Mucilaginibacter rivuli]MBW4891254.1 GNAT family N-acetyltransferase [Mucilaginibacter rivuli]